MEKNYSVICQHNTGHGISSSEILLTSNMVLAIDTVQNAEKLGYQFYGNDTFVSVMEIEKEYVYTKEGLKYYGDTPKDYPYIFLKRRYNKEWKDEWLRKDCEKLYKREKLEKMENV